MTDEPEREGRGEGAATSRTRSDSSASKSAESAEATRGTTESALPERPRPLDRSLRWVPRKLRLSGREVTTPADVFLPRAVLRELRERLRPVSETGEDVGGLLGGRLFRCPESGRPWVRIDSLYPLPEAFPEDADADRVGDALEAAREALEASGERPVGWYHSHSLLGVFLSDRDVQLHRRFFPEAWQCALVLVADDRRPAGGLFQALNGELPRSVYVPFHELADEGEAGLARNSILGWENYTPDEPSRRSVAALGATGRARAAAGEAGAPGRARPSDGAGARGKPGAGGPGAGRTGRGRSGPGPRRGGSGPGEPGRGESAGGGRPPAGPRRPGPLESGHPAEVPLVLPADEGPGLWDRWDEHRRTVLRLGVILLVLLGGWLLWDRVIDRPEGFFGEAAERPAAEAVAGEGEGAAATERERAAAFDRAVAAFSSSVEAYDERSSDFDLGRIGCEGLGIGYRSVDEAFVGASEAFVRLRDQASAAPTERYEEAAARMEEVDRHFDASGCARPE